MSAMSSLRSLLYKSARTLGDAEAAAKGPSAYGRRLVRKRVYRRGNGLIASLLKLAKMR